MPSVQAGTVLHSPMAWHRMSTSFSTSAKITFGGSAVKYGGSWGKQTKVNKQSHSKVRNRCSLKKNSSENLSTGGLFDIEGYKQIVQVKASVKKKKPDNFCHAE